MDLRVHRQVTKTRNGAQAPSAGNCLPALMREAKVNMYDDAETELERLSDPELEPTGILWILVRDVKVTKQPNGSYLAEELDGNGRTCVIAYGTEDGEMKFDDRFIATEDFMAYVGMLDYVDESPNHSATFRNDIVTND